MSANFDLFVDSCQTTFLMKMILYLALISIQIFCEYLILTSNPSTFSLSLSLFLSLSLYLSLVVSRYLYLTLTVIREMTFSHHILSNVLRKCDVVETKLSILWKTLAKTN